MNTTQILVVGYQLPEARKVQSFLERLGYAVAGIVCSGEQAVQGAVTAPVDLVLVDMTCHPQGDGWDAVEQIHHRFNLPVVQAVASADEARLRQVTAPCCYGCI